MIHIPKPLFKKILPFYTYQLCLNALTLQGCLYFFKLQRQTITCLNLQLSAGKAKHVPLLLLFILPILQALGGTDSKSKSTNGKYTRYNC